MFKALILPIIEYPPIIIRNFSIFNVKKLQVVQSKALRAIANEGLDRRPTNEALHIKYNIEPFNQRIYNLSERIWNKLSETDPGIIETSIALDEYPGREHKWWPRTSVTLRNNIPEPIYV